jgi:hypothetical protein
VRFNVTNVDDEESIQTNDSKLEEGELLLYSDAEDPHPLSQFEAASCQMISYDYMNMVPHQEPRSRA